MHEKHLRALMHAHQGRAGVVASLHVLRQPRLEPDDHAFLLANVGELGPSDLLRWRSRSEPGLTMVVIREMARQATHDPVSFRHEILDAPKLDLEDDEWRELADLLRGRIPDPIFALLLERGGARPKRPPPDRLFTPGVIAAESAVLDDSDVDGGDPVDYEAARKLPLAELLAKRRRGLLPLEDGDFQAICLERAHDDVEDWSALTPDIPGQLKDAVLEKAIRTPRADERANLLTWLMKHDYPRKAMLGVALAPLPGGSGDFGFGLIDWLARRMSTRSAWDDAGTLVFDAFLSRGAFGELAELLALAVSEAQRAGGDPARKYVQAIQVALATTLVTRARRAIVERDDAAAMRALSALACLDPPSRVSRAVHELRRLDVGPELDELIAVNERMIKHGTASEASLEGLVAAVHALADG